MLKLPHRSSRVSSTSGPLPCWHCQSHLQLIFVCQVFKGELHFGPLPCRQYLSISNSDQLASWSKHGEVFNPGLSLAFLNRRERLTAKAVVSRRLAKTDTILQLNISHHLLRIFLQILIFFTTKTTWTTWTTACGADDTGESFAKCHS